MQRLQLEEKFAHRARCVNAELSPGLPPTSAFRSLILHFCRLKSVICVSVIMSGKSVTKQHPLFNLYLRLDTKIPILDYSTTGCNGLVATVFCSSTGSYHFLRYFAVIRCLVEATKNSEVPKVGVSVSNGYVIVATQTFELQFFPKSIGDDFF